MSERVSWRRVLRRVHLWLAVIVGLPLIAQGLSGSLLVYEAELTRVAVAPTEPGHPSTVKPLAAILAAAGALAPREARPVLYLAPAAPGEAARVRFAPTKSGGAAPAMVALDPGSLAPVSLDTPLAGVIMLAHRIHGAMLIEGPTGRAVVGWVGIVLMILCLTGLVMWWPRSGTWSRALSVRSRGGEARRQRDLHGVIGFVTSALLIVLAATGAGVAFPRSLASIVAVVSGETPSGMAAPESRPPTNMAPSGAAPKPLDPKALAEAAERAVTVALARLPDHSLRAVSFPRAAGQPFQVRLAAPEAEPLAPLVTVSIETGGVEGGAARIVKIADPAREPGFLGLLPWLKPLHSGGVLGPAWRVSVCCAGLSPFLLALTGSLFWLAKRRARRAARDGGSRLPARRSPETSSPSVAEGSPT